MSVDDLAPVGPDETARHLAGICDAAGERLIVDFGCGSGRIALPLAEAGVPVVAVDRDLAPLRTAMEHLAPSVASLLDAIELDFLADDALAHLRGVIAGRPVGAIALVGWTIGTLVEHEQVERLFGLATSLLDDGGAIVLDDLPGFAWGEVAEGYWADGVSEDESMQMLWLPGEPTIIVRTGDAVDPEEPAARIGERRIRLWGRSDLRFFARRAGLSIPDEGAWPDGYGLLRATR